MLTLPGGKIRYHAIFFHLKKMQEKNTMKLELCIKGVKIFLKCVLS